MLDLLVIGAGKMGGALAAGFADAAPESFQLGVYSRQRDSVDRVVATNPRVVACDRLEQARNYLVAVKPHQISAVIGALPPGGVISIAAGITLDQLSAWISGERQIVRAMPNTPVSVKAGVCALAAGADSADLLSEAKAMFAWVGRAYEVEEGMFNAVSAISGSGPAYLFMVMEAMQEAGIARGIPASLALELARETVIGAGVLARESGSDPRTLRLAVTSPGGMTAAALAELERSGLRSGFSQAIRAATEAASGLSNKA